MSDHYRQRIDEALPDATQRSELFTPSTPIKPELMTKTGISVALLEITL